MKFKLSLNLNNINFSSVSNIIENIALWLMLVFTFVAPFAFLPIFISNAFDFPKWLLTAGTALLMAIMAGLYMFFEKKAIIPSNKFTIPLSLFAVAVLLSVFLNDSNKIAAFYGKAGLLLSFIVIVLSNLIVIKNKAKLLFYPLIGSAFVLSVLEILSFLGLTSKILRNEMFSAKTFTPMGMQLSLASFLLVILSMTLVYAFKNKLVVSKIVLFLLAGVQTVALVFAVSQILPGQPASIKTLPYSSGWSIAVDQLKTGKTALLGVGPDSFSIAFSQFRPAILNGSKDWFIRFGSSSNEILTIFTTLGLLGLLAFILTVLMFVKSSLAKKDDSTMSNALSVGLIVTILLFIFIPASYAMFFLVFILGIIVASSDDSDSLSFSHPIFYVLSGLVFVAGPLFLSYFLANAVLAEAAFGDSLRFANENKGAETYNAQIKAISLNPNIANYRVVYSSTNLALANSLASKKDITEDDKKNVTQLVYQSIREAKAAVALDPKNSIYWVNLAQIYRQLINFAQGSDQWALSSYVQAIRLDSTNPQLRLDLGGLLYSLNQYEQAIDQFKQAISLKPDFANAYYNLSYAYKQMKQYPQAYAAMQNVVNIIDANSADHERAISELNSLQALLPKEAQQATTSATKSTSQLTKPQPTPSPRAAGPLDINADQKKNLEPPVDQTAEKAGTATPSAAKTEVKK